MNSQKKMIKIVAVIAVFFFIGKGLVGCFHQNGNLEVIRSVKVIKDDLEITVSTTGEVKPYNRVEIKPSISGRVEDVLVKEGDQVKQGQVLAWMSSIDRAALLDAAHSQGEEVYQKWLAAYKPAPLTAPLDGMVIVRAVEPGQTVTTADPVVVLSDRLIIKAQADETDLARIQVGQDTEIILDAYRDNSIYGMVDHISYESQLVNNVNVYDIDVIPEEIPKTFRSGMTATVTFFVEDRKNVLLIPSEAITEWPRKMKRPGGTEFAVYRKDFNGLTPLPVQIGATDGKMTEIKSGLSEGMEIQVVRRKQNKNSGSALSSMSGRGAGPSGGAQRSNRG